MTEYERRRYPPWFRDIPLWVKVLVTLGTVFLAGMSTYAAVSSQLAVPTLLRRTVGRVDTLNLRVNIIEHALPELSTGVNQSRSNAILLDSLYHRTEDIWCVLRAHVLEQDPFAMCTMGLPPRRD